ncbi:MAG: hypothetical protein AAF269_15765, partial [Pseudomonadota bacterium]
TEMALASGIGVFLNGAILEGLKHDKRVDPTLTTTQLLFGESSGRLLISVSIDDVDDVQAKASDEGVICTPMIVGTLPRNSEIKYIEYWHPGGTLQEKTSFRLARLRDAHEGWLPTYMSAVD